LASFVQRTASDSILNRERNKGAGQLTIIRVSSYEGITEGLVNEAVVKVLRFARPSTKHLLDRSDHPKSGQGRGIRRTGLLERAIQPDKGLNCIPFTDEFS
jgi:hypothetical protein